MFRVLLPKLFISFINYVTLHVSLAKTATDIWPLLVCANKDGEYRLKMEVVSMLTEIYLTTSFICSSITMIFVLT
jgi:hypothetical protein